AETSYRQAITLKPDYAEAHNNLGVMLQGLGKLDEVEASYRKAITLKPDYAEAHNNLGVILQELGRLDEAEKSYRKAIELKPDYAEAYNNLGNTLIELERIDEAEKSYRKAIELKPDYAEAHYNLGVMLQELGRLDEAEKSYRKAIELKPDYAEAHYNLSNNLSYKNDLEKEIYALKNLLKLDDDGFKLIAGINLAICNFLEGDFTESKKQVLAAEKIQKKTLSKFNNEKLYQKYLLKILKWHEDKYLDVDKGKKNKTLYVLGESHSLASHHLHIQHSEIDFFCKARLIKGCKQWHLGNASRNQFKNKFESIFCSLPKYSYVLLAIGEIDCRLDSGIIKHKNKYPAKQISEIIQNTVENYLSYIVDNNSDNHHKIIIQGVPCPTIDRCINHEEKDVKQLIEVIKIFNFELKIIAEKKRLGFLDVHKLTDRGDGFSNSIWHIDNHHISPEGIIEAWSRYTC
ncbi:tetratricopeptide repeat protein, partial [Candidatus Pelagibacter sp.]|nr:tetratricopeptide repeat protein [Candidatus Pelagibacter sp.]